MLRIMHSLIVGRSLSPNRRDPSKALAFPILRRRVSEVLECVSVLLDTVGGSRPSRPRSPPYVNLQSDRLGGISVDPGAGMHPCRVNDCTCTTQFRGTHCSERVDGREEGCEGSLPWRPEQGRVDEQWCPGKYLAFAHKPYPRPYPLPSTHPVLNFEILNSSRKKRNTSQTIAYTQPCKSLFQSSRPPSLLHPKPPPPPQGGLSLLRGLHGGASPQSRVLDLLPSFPAKDPHSGEIAPTVAVILLIIITVRAILLIPCMCHCRIISS